MRRRDAAAVLTLLVVLLGTGLPARADPVYPSQDDVRRAQQKAAAAAGQVDALQAQLDRTTARVEAADVALSTAAEDYDSARIELVDSQRAAQAAAEVSQQAVQRLSTAQRQVGRLAAQAYRSGGPLASLEVLMSPTGPEDVLERASMMRTLAGQRQQTVQKMDAARVVAATLDQQADQALTRQLAAAARLAKAKAAAEQQAVSVRATLIAQTDARTVLVTRLATARRTSVAVEQARQDGLAEAAARRQEVQRERAAAREAARQRARDRAAGSSGGSSGGSGSGSGSTAPAPADPAPSAPAPGGGSSSGSASAGQSAVNFARTKLGLPYQWGGAGPGSYDCSGLTMRAWAQAGVQMPHSSRIQYQQVDKISYSALRAGDLLFYATNTANPQSIHHVAMYIGGGQMIEAPYTGANVRITALRRTNSMPYAGRP